ncbi:hypothetical protein DRO30_05560, partial [Candidatus Bathyarchaeota archaeon]
MLRWGAGLREAGLDLLDDVGVLRRHVALLAGVAAQVVELGRLVGAEADALPLAHAHGLVEGAVDLPVEEVVGPLGLAKEGGEDGHAVEALRGADAGELAGRREDVHLAPDEVTDLPCGDSARPPGDGG